MIKRLTHVAPLQCGTVLAVLYGLFGLIFVPFFLIFAVVGSSLPHGDGPALPGAAFGIGAVAMAVIFPIMYAIFGFIGGIIAAFIYNLVAGWTGGLEFTTVDAPTAVSASVSLPPKY